MGYNEKELKGFGLKGGGMQKGGVAKNYAKSGWKWLLLPVALYILTMPAGLFLGGVTATWYLLITFFILSLISLLIAFSRFIMAALKQNKLYILLAIIALLLIMLFGYFGLLAYNI